MKFLHTSDLHIGLKLCEYGMNDDLRHILAEIKNIALEKECDAVVIAGDIYDRSNPSPESVTVFDEFVSSLAESRITVLAVSGNHDSPERVAYMSSLLSKKGVHFSPVFDKNGVYYTDLCDEYGDVRFYLLPFIRPINVRETFDEFGGSTYTEAVDYVLKEMSQEESAPERRVLVTHHFVVGGTGDDRGESGQIEENIGGIGAVDADVFRGFKYTALGHLHSPHFVGRRELGIRYSGSPLKCSFSEVNDEKTVTIVELDGGGIANIEEVPLHPIRGMREIRGTYAEVISKKSREMGDRLDYVRIILTDDDEIQDVAAKLRNVYPNIMRISYDNIKTREIRDVSAASAEEIEALTPESVFAELFELQQNTAPSDEIKNIVSALFEDCFENEGGNEA